MQCVAKWVQSKTLVIIGKASFNLVILCHSVHLVGQPASG